MLEANSGGQIVSFWQLPQQNLQPWARSSSGDASRPREWETVLSGGKWHLALSDMAQIALQSSSILSQFVGNALNGDSEETKRPEPQVITNSPLSAGYSD